MFYSESKELWVERVYDQKGKRHDITAKTKKALKEKLANRTEIIEKGPTFAAMADAWINHHAEKVEITTANAYSAHVERAKDFFAGELIKNITPDECQAFVDHLVELDFAKDTVRRGLVVLNKIFKYAITQPDSPIRFNPCSAVEVPRGLKQTQREPPTKEQLDIVALADPTDEVGLFVWFLWFTGLRPGELLALRWEDIDREKKEIRVNKAIQYPGNQAKLKDKTKTPAGMRTVPLLDILAEVLPEQGTGYIFGREKPWSKTMVQKKWLMWCREHGLAEEIVTKFTGKNGHKYKRTRYKAKVTAYQFRHEYASVLEDEQVSEFAAQHTMGHASITTTKDKYTHFRQRRENQKGEVAEKLNARYNGKGAPKGAPKETNS